MTRHKKSRKPGVAPVSSNRDDKTKLTSTSDKKPKKLKGKKPGNRQQEATKTVKQLSGEQATKDPRIGSKKPIILATKASPKNSTTKRSQKSSSPIAAVKVVDNNQNLLDELHAIEDDQLLQDIITKQEQEIQLTEKEIDYFNNSMDRHQALRAELGLDDEDDTESSQEFTSEEALWDKLDNNDFSEFEPE